MPISAPLESVKTSFSTNLRLSQTARAVVNIPRQAVPSFNLRFGHAKMTVRFINSYWWRANKQDHVVRQHAVTNPK